MGDREGERLMTEIIDLSSLIVSVLGFVHQHPLWLSMSRINPSEMRKLMGRRATHTRKHGRVRLSVLRSQRAPRHSELGTEEKLVGTSRRMARSAAISLDSIIF